MTASEKVELFFHTFPNNKWREESSLGEDSKFISTSFAKRGFLLTNDERTLLEMMGARNVMDHGSKGEWNKTIGSVCTIEISSDDSGNELFPIDNLIPVAPVLTEV